MKVYYAGNDQANHTAYVAPAADPVGIRGGVDSEWLDDDGRARTITVVFRGGEATVPDALGRYLVAVGIAKKTRLILPRGRKAA